jgi:hypothetical protein
LAWTESVYTMIIICQLISLCGHHTSTMAYICGTRTKFARFVCNLVCGLTKVFLRAVVCTLAGRVRHRATEDRCIWVRLGVSAYRRET